MGSGTIYKRGSVYWIGYMGIDGNQRCESSHSKVRSDATRLLDLRSGAIANGSPVMRALGRLTFAEATADLVNDYSTNKRRSLPDVKRRIELHLTPYFGPTRRMASISTADVRKYIAHRQTQTKRYGGPIARHWLMAGRAPYQRSTATTDARRPRRRSTANLPR